MGTSFIFNSLVPRLSSSLASQPVFLQEEGKVSFPPRKQRLARETSSHPAFRRLHYEKRIDEKLMRAWERGLILPMIVLFQFLVLINYLKLMPMTSYHRQECMKPLLLTKCRVCSNVQSL